MPDVIVLLYELLDNVEGGTKIAYNGTLTKAKRKKDIRIL